MGSILELKVCKNCSYAKQEVITDKDSKVILCTKYNMYTATNRTCKSCKVREDVENGNG